MQQKSTLRANLLMLITAMIWGSTFLGQNIAMSYMGALTFSGIRFLLGTATLIPVVLFYQKKNDIPLNKLFTQKTVIGGIVLGIILTLGINLQQVGIKYTTITNSGFITGLYVIIVPILGLVIGQRTGLGTWFGAILAVIGMGLLSLNSHLSVAFGDLITLIGAVAWGLHVLVVGILVNRYDPIAVAFMQCLTCAILSLLLAIPFEGLHAEFSQQAIIAIAYTGAVSVAISFTLQLVAQKDAIASHAAIILSLEAVFAAICGAIFLNEELSIRGYIGCALMFTGMLVAQLWPTKKANPSTATA